MKLQRVRGVSFREEYAHSSLAALRRWRREKLPPPKTSTITSTATTNKIQEALIAPKESRFDNRITVVLDLDETLVYAREGPLYVRPGLEELFQFLKENCETIVWTAGIKAYADAVVRNIDTTGAVRHTIYRDSQWFTGNSCCKDLRLLGRDTETTIVFENTPDCIRGFEQNGVLVADYEGGELEDRTLYGILGLLKELVRRRAEERITVPEYTRTSCHLKPREVPTDKGDVMVCYCLNAGWSEMERTARTASLRCAPSKVEEDSLSVAVN